MAKNSSGVPPATKHAAIRFDIWPIIIDLQFSELGGGVGQCWAAWWSINRDPPKSISKPAKINYPGFKLAIYTAKNILR